jgi:sortase A
MDPLRRALLALAAVAVLATASGCGGKANAAESTARASVPPAEQAVPPAKQAASPAEQRSAAPVAAVPESIASAPAADALAAPAPGALPDRFVLPAIDVDIPVVELGWSQKSDQAGQTFSAWDEADFAAGWHKNSALPGQAGNVVLSGHNNIKGAVFRELDQLQRGDVAILYVGDTPYEYAVDQVMIVPEASATLEQRKVNAQWIQPTGDDRLTLVSCWPRDDNTHRIIVVARPVTAPSVPN